MNNLNPKTIRIVIVCLGLLVICTAAGTANTDDDQWRIERGKGDLLEREHQLLKRNDDLANHIALVKQEIKTLQTQLASDQEESDRVRHELIVIHLKLLP